jgi:hypothetical protein
VSRTHFHTCARPAPHHHHGAAPKPSLPEGLPEASDPAAADGQDEVDGWVELELPRVVGGAADLADPAEVDGLARLRCLR